MFGHLSWSLTAIFFLGVAVASSVSGDDDATDRSRPLREVDFIGFSRDGRFAFQRSGPENAEKILGRTGVLGYVLSNLVTDQVEEFETDAERFAKHLQRYRIERQVDVQVRALPVVLSYEKIDVVLVDGFDEGTDVFLRSNRRGTKSIGTVRPSRLGKSHVMNPRYIRSPFEDRIALLLDVAVGDQSALTIFGASLTHGFTKESLAWSILERSENDENLIADLVKALADPASIAIAIHRLRQMQRIPHEIMVAMHSFRGSTLQHRSIKELIATHKRSISD